MTTWPPARPKMDNFTVDLFCWRRLLIYVIIPLLRWKMRQLLYWKEKPKSYQNGPSLLFSFSTEMKFYKNCFKTSSLLLFLKQFQMRTRCSEQCDQMASLFFQYLAIYWNEKLLFRHNVCQRRFKILPYTKWVTDF